MRCASMLFAAALVCVHGILPASAATISFIFDPGTSFAFFDGGAGDLTGILTINPSGPGFSGDDVVVTGGVEAGTYAPFENDSPVGAFIYLDQHTGGHLIFFFAQNLNSAPQESLLERVNWQPASPPPQTFATTVTGGATLVPEPSTWAMMLLGFVGLGCAAYGNSRKKNCDRAVSA
jgi:PEP-CTERM motif